ncbi:hypothetical protein HC891_00090 [Candidatus Gracilibacteria bacterium]|nr:hypothetical protein [Candidatus Gracilibacteria bacterium]
MTPWPPIGRSTRAGAQRSHSTMRLPSSLALRRSRLRHNAKRGAIFFTLAEDADAPIRREDVLGLSFRINGGADYIGNDELAVSVIGSNAVPYFTRDKTTAQERADADLEFSETRLYFLDINTDIPPDTWVEVVVWLDNLIFDPDYKYVTGFYIKNAPSFLNTYYIDEVKLLVQQSLE